MSWLAQLLANKALASDSTGVKATYTAPTSIRAAVRDHSCTRITGGTVDAEYIQGANTFVVRTFTAAYNEQRYIVLLPGELFRVNVTTAGAAGSVFDFIAGGEEG